MNTRGLLLCDDTATCWWLQSHCMQAKHGTVKSSPRRGDCNGHTVNTWLTPSLLGLQYQSTVDLRSYLQIQLNQLRINHQCHIDAPVWTYAFYKLSACYKVAPHRYSCLDPQLVPCPCLAPLHSLDPVQKLVWNKPCFCTVLLVVTRDLSDLATIRCNNNAAEWKCRAMQASKCDLLDTTVA